MDLFDINELKDFLIVCKKVRKTLRQYNKGINSPIFLHKEYHIYDHDDTIHNNISRLFYEMYGIAESKICDVFVSKELSGANVKDLTQIINNIILTISRHDNDYDKFLKKISKS